MTDVIKEGGHVGGGWPPSFTPSPTSDFKNLPPAGEGLLKDTHTRNPQTSAWPWLSHSTLAFPGEAPAGVGRGWAEGLGRLKAPLQEAKEKVGSPTLRRWAQTSNLAAVEFPVPHLGQLPPLGALGLPTL